MNQNLQRAAQGPAGCGWDTPHAQPRAPPDDWFLGSGGRGKVTPASGTQTHAPRVRPGLCEHSSINRPHWPPISQALSSLPQLKRGRTREVSTLPRVTQQVGGSCCLPWLGVQNHLHQRHFPGRRNHGLSVGSRGRLCVSPPALDPGPREGSRPLLPVQFTSCSEFLPGTPGLAPEARPESVWAALCPPSPAGGS